MKKGPRLPVFGERFVDRRPCAVCGVVTAHNPKGQVYTSHRQSPQHRRAMREELARERAASTLPAPNAPAAPEGDGTD